MCELQYALPRDGAAREQLVGRYYPNSDPNPTPNPNPNPNLDPNPNPNQVGLGYLKSYEGMGRVRVECARGCSSPACQERHHPPPGATAR